MQVRRLAVPLAVLALALAVLVPVAGAQMGGVTVDGTPALFVFGQTTGLAYTAATGAPVVVNISGEDAAFAALCSGNLDVVSAARPISDAESADCDAHGVAWVELLVGWDGLAVYSNDPATTCLTTGELADAFGDSGPAVFGRGREYQTYFAQALGLDALRADLVTANDDAGVLAAFQPISATALAYTSLAGALASNLPALEVDGGDGCVAPSPESIESGDYPLSRPLYLYASVGSGERPEVSGFVDYALAPANTARLPELGLITAGEANYTLGAYNWSQRATGRTFSAPPVEMAAISGADLTLYNGAADLAPVVQTLAAAITDENADAQYQVAAAGTDAGIARLCNGELDLAGANRAISDAEIAQCAENGIDFLELLVGANALTVVTNRANDYAICLNVPQIAAIFGADSAGDILRWEQVQDGFPPFDLVVVPGSGAAADLFEAAFGPLRTDFAAGNVGEIVGSSEAVVGVMTYGEFVATDAASNGALNATAVNAGAGCIQPSGTSIQDGSYPLAAPLYLYVNAEGAARPAVQRVIVDLLGDSGTAAFDAAGLLPTSEVNAALDLDVLQARTPGRFFTR